MALAFLQLVDSGERKVRLKMDTGTSPYFELVTGKTTIDRNGTKFIDDIQTRTGIKKVANYNPLRTDTEFVLDKTKFEGEHRFIQLFSYQTANGKGSSFSEVVEVRQRLLRKENDGDLPVIKLPKFLSMSASYTYSLPGRVSHSLSERQVSEAMLFSSLLPMVTKILPVAQKVLGGLAGGGTGNILGNLLPVLGNLLGGAAAPVPAQPTQPAGNGSSAPPAPAFNLAELLKPETITAIKGLIDQFTQKEKMSGQKSVTEKVSPALLQLSPVIAPILEKIITPEALAAIGGNPQKLYAAIADCIAQLPDKDIQTIKKLLVQTTPTELVKAKSETNYSQPMFWQALLSMITPDMVNAVGNQANNTMKTAQEGILNLKKEQARFVEALIPKGDINQPVIKDMIGAISQYNLLTHQPQNPQQVVAQSLGTFTNALCQIIPVVEKSMSDDSLVNETQEKTKDLVDKIQNEFFKLQEDIKKKMLKSMKEKIEEQVDNIDIKALSFQFSQPSKYDSGLKIFNCAETCSPRKEAAKTMAKLLPIAYANEFKRTSQALRNTRSAGMTFESSDPAVSLMLEKIDDAVRASKNNISYVKDDKFSLEVTGAKKTLVNGIPKVVYVPEKGIRFAVTLQQGKQNSSLPKCMIQVQIKSGNDKETAIEKIFRFTDLKPGTLIDNLAFETGELKTLPLNKDLLVCFTLLWKEKKAVKGSRKCHSIYLTRNYLFDGVRGLVKPGIPLNNITEHRDFWHKVWESTGSYEKKRFNIDCKYYLFFNPNSSQNNQVKTKLLAKKGTEVSESEYEAEDDFLKIKTGLEITANSLNSLLPKISKYPSLSENQLEVLRAGDVRSLIDTAGVAHMEFKNKKGEKSIVWVYPEVDLVELAFKKAHSINAFGNVVEFVEEKAIFPKPSALHFIGTKN